MRRTLWIFVLHVCWQINKWFNILFVYLVLLCIFNVPATEGIKMNKTWFLKHLPSHGTQPNGGNKYTNKSKQWRNGRRCHFFLFLYSSHLKLSSILTLSRYVSSPTSGYFVHIVLITSNIFSSLSFWIILLHSSELTKTSLFKSSP